MERTSLKRPFQCSWPGCTNSYARSEHLNRHKLNHEPIKIYQCESCPKTFVRSDLLFRHKDRHAKRAVKRSPPDSRLKSIRPARSDSTSSREDAGQQGTEAMNLPNRSHDSMSCSSYSSSVDGGLSRSLSHPRFLLQSPFSSTSFNQTQSTEDMPFRYRSNTLQLPSLGTSPDAFLPYSQANLDIGQSQRLSVSPILPPILQEQPPRNRTYSIESMLNKPTTFKALSLHEMAIQE